MDAGWWPQSSVMVTDLKTGGSIATLHAVVLLIVFIDQWFLDRSVVGARLGMSCSGEIEPTHPWIRGWLLTPLGRLNRRAPC